MGLEKCQVEEYGLKFNIGYMEDDSTHGHHQMVNTKVKLIIFFAAIDGEAVYSQQKQYWELTVAQDH